MIGMHQQISIMFNHENRITIIKKSLDDSEELFDIMGMKSYSRLIEKINRMSPK
jgi:hypothetical protein